MKINEKTKTLFLSTLVFGTAALWAIKGMQLLKARSNIAKKEFSEGLASELQSGFDELDGLL